MRKIKDMLKRAAPIALGVALAAAVVTPALMWVTRQVRARAGV